MTDFKLSQLDIVRAYIEGAKQNLIKADQVLSYLQYNVQEVESIRETLRITQLGCNRAEKQRSDFLDNAEKNDEVS